MPIRRLCVLACSALMLAGCAPEREQTLSISGSSTIAPLMAEIGQRFEARHPGVRVDVQSGGTSRGIQDVRGGLAALGMVSRALNADEHDLTAHAIARDGIALIVHADNPLKDIGSAQVVGLYTGRLSDWRPSWPAATRSAAS